MAEGLLASAGWGSRNLYTVVILATGIAGADPEAVAQRLVSAGIPAAQIKVINAAEPPNNDSLSAGLRDRLGYSGVSVLEHEAGECVALAAAADDVAAAGKSWLLLLEDQSALTVLPEAGRRLAEALRGAQCDSGALRLGAQAIWSSSGEVPFGAWL